MDLTEKTCVPCEGGVPAFTNEQEEEHVKQIVGWEIDRRDVHKLKKTLELRNMNDALEFTGKVDELAEKEGHHPNVSFESGKVSIEIWTHAVKGLTENDFILAAKIDQL